MPFACAGKAKYAWMDHDTAYINEAPPVQNQWYTVFDDEDVRLLYCAVMTTDLLAAGATFEMLWTIDGNEYFIEKEADSGTQYYIYRGKYPSTAGTKGLSVTTDIINAAFHEDKRGLRFKVEVRITTAVLATDILEAWCVYETLELT